MTTGKALDGKPYAGNPHVRFDEGEVAPAATPRRGSLLYKAKKLMKKMLVMMSVMLCGMAFGSGSWQLREDYSSYTYQRIEATHNGSDSTSYTVKVPAGKKATVLITVTSVSSENIDGKTIYTKWNSGSERYLVGQGSTSLDTFTSDGSVTIGVRCSPGTHEVPHEKVTYVGVRPIYSLYYTTEYWKYYSCEVIYDIRVTYEALLPDLTVDEFSLSKTEVPVGETVVLSYAIKNAGGKPATSSIAHIYDGERRLKTVEIEELAVGATISGTLELDNLAVGTHEMRIVTDATSVVEEGSESNNDKTASLEIYDRKPYTVHFDANGGTGTMPDQSFVSGTAAALAANVFTNGDQYFMGWARTADGDVEYADGKEVLNLSKTGGMVTLYARWKRIWQIENGVLIKAFPDPFRSVTVPEGVVSIGEDAFADCVNMTNVILASTVTSIGDRAFKNCSGLAQVTIPKGVTSIGEYAFRGCSGLTSVTIPNSVTSIVFGAFSDCQRLKSVHITDLAAWCEISVAPFVWSGNEGFDLYLNGLLVTDLTIPDVVTSIGNYAFLHCKTLTQVTIPEGVTSIGGSSFCGCDNLTSVILPSTVTNIGGSAFSSCYSLAQVTIPKGVTSIESHTFYECIKLREVRIPSTVTNIDWAAFAYCHSLRRVIFDGDSPNLNGRTEYIFRRDNNSHDTAPKDCIVYVRHNSSGWGVNIPGKWVDGVPIRYYDYIAEFDPNGGMITEGENGYGVVKAPKESRPVYYGATVGKLPVAARDGYTFDGWFTAADGGERVSAETVVTADVTYYAHWTANGYTIKLNANGGDGTMSDIAMTYDVAKNLTANGFTKRVSSFAGWATSADGEAVFADGSTVSNLTAEADDVVTLYAVWQVNQYKVTFDANGGTGGWSRSMDYGTAISAPTVTRTGYTFGGWSPVVPETVPASNVTYTAQWTKIVGPAPVSPTPVVPTPVKPIPVAPTPVTPDPGVCYVALNATDIVAPYEAPKAVTLQGAVYDGCTVVGIVELKLGRVNVRRGTSRLSGSVTTLDGKKHTIKSYNVMEVDGETSKTVSVDVKDLGTMTVTIGGAMFAGSLGDWHVQSADVGGNWSKGDATVTVDAYDLSMFAGTVLSGFLPQDEQATVAGGKWAFKKAASVKWAKPKKGVALTDLPIYDEASGKGLVVDTAKGKTNLSGMKLTYTPKKGTFKGSFKVYALEGAGKATKLKKYTVKVTGIVVDGVGYGEATCKRPAASWSVTVR